MPRRENMDKALGDVHFDYEYPILGDKRLDLRPGSAHTQKIIDEIDKRVQASREKTAPMHSRWREMERTKTVYMPADQYDAINEANDPRKPMRFIVPTTFKACDLFKTFLSDRFLKQDVIHYYQALGGPESIVKCSGLERVNMLQGFWFKERLHLQTLWDDGISYGRGRVAVKWKKKVQNVPKREEASELLAMMMSQIYGIPAKAKQMIPYVEAAVLAEGTAIEPLDIRQCFFDPSVSTNNQESASFGGWIYEASDADLLEREQDPEEYLFNCRYVAVACEKGLGDSRHFDRSDSKGVNDASQYDFDLSRRETQSKAHVTRMCVHFIPRRWFGEGFPDYPVKMCFSIAADDIVIQAYELDYDHGSWDWLDYAPNDGHCLDPTALLHTIQCYQKAGNIMLKSRMEAIYTILNGLIFFDPTKVNKEDMLNPGMGKLVRVTPNSYGEGGIERFVHQMQISDPTVNHMANAAELDTMARDGIGATDLALGSLSGMPDRPTKAGINAATGGTFSRLDRYALVTDEQIMGPLGTMMAFNTRQFMSQEIYAPVAGRNEMQLRKFYGLPSSGDHSIPVLPDNMDFAFQCMPRSAIRPGGPDAAALTELAKVMMSVPEVMQEFVSRYNGPDVIAYAFEKSGLDQIWDMQTADNETVIQQADAGNIVPMPQGMPQGAYA